MPYALQPMLRIRVRREDRAATELVAARTAEREAERALEERKEELKEIYSELRDPMEEAYERLFDIAENLSNEFDYVVPFVENGRIAEFKFNSGSLQTLADVADIGLVHITGTCSAGY